MKEIKVKILSSNGYDDFSIIGKVFNATIDRFGVISIDGKEIKKHSQDEEWDDDFEYCFLNDELEIL